MANKENEYIGALDVMEFFWLRRFYLIGFGLLGLVAAVVVTKVRPPIFVNNLPVRIDNNPTTGQTVAVNRFNRFVASPEISSKIYENLASSTDLKVKAAFESQQWSKEAFVDLQARTTPSTPLRFVERDGELFMESRYKIHDEAAVLSRALIQASHDVLTKHNEEQASKSKAPDLEETSRVLQGAVAQYRDVIIKRENELVTIRLKVFALEASLAARLGGPASNYPSSNEQDQVTRLLGFLLHAKKMTQREAVEIAALKSTYQGEIDAVRAKYDQLLMSIGSTVAKNGNDAVVLSTPTLNADFVPTATLVTGLLDERLAAGTIERLESKRILVLLSGLMAGLVAGLFVYAAADFVRTNRVKLQAILKS